MSSTDKKPVEQKSGTPEPKPKKGIKIRGTGAATKGTTARGPMA